MNRMIVSALAAGILTLGMAISPVMAQDGGTNGGGTIGGTTTTQVADDRDEGMDLGWLGLLGLAGLLGLRKKENNVVHRDTAVR